MSEHVLIVGIDGVRYDVLMAEPTPVLAAVAEKGFLAPLRVNDAGPTISGPCWASIVSGVLADRHEIYGNDLSPNRLAEFPDIVHLAGGQRPDLARFVASGWLPLVTTESGGPLFTDGGWSPPGAQAHLPHEWRVADQAVTDACVGFLDDHDGSNGSLVFCYLGGVDEVGHLLGVGPEYRAFVRDSDTRLGELLAAVERRPHTEEWTILVGTDHGHVDAGGHGGESDLERTAWIAASGRGVPTHAPDCLEQVDIAGHAAHVLGLTPVPGFAGQPFGERRPGD